MSKAVFLIDESRNLRELPERQYDSEALLQELLARYPNLLAGDQIDPDNPRRWILVSREIGIPSPEDPSSNRWSLDHLFLDQDAIPTLVEVKRSSDTRIRREVVGQMLDYASNAVVYWPIESLKARFDQTCAESGLDPDAAISDILSPEQSIDEYWMKAKLNLQAGKVRLVFIADSIPSELRRIVEFLNDQMDPAEVLAIEVRQFTDDKVRTLVPTVIGQTETARSRKSAGRSANRQWDEPSFMEHMEQHCRSGEIEFAKRIMSWARDRVTRLWWGKGARSGSFVPIIETSQGKHQLFAVWSTGTIELYFFWYARKEPFKDPDMLDELLAKINHIPGINLEADAIRKRPNIALSEISTKESQKAFFDVFEWFIDQVGNINE
jgi:hypothetical protein